MTTFIQILNVTLDVLARGAVYNIKTDATLTSQFRGFHLLKNVEECIFASLQSLHFVDGLFHLFWFHQHEPPVGVDSMPETPRAQISLVVADIAAKAGCSEIAVSHSRRLHNVVGTSAWRLSHIHQQHVDLFWYLRMTQIYW